MFFLAERRMKDIGKEKGKTGRQQITGRESPTTCTQTPIWAVLEQRGNERVLQRQDFEYPLFVGRIQKLSKTDFEKLLKKSKFKRKGQLLPERKT